MIGIIEIIGIIGSIGNSIKPKRYAQQYPYSDAKCMVKMHSGYFRLFISIFCQNWINELSF